MTALAISIFIFHWSWENTISSLCIFLILLAWNYGRSKLTKALRSKHRLAAKVGPELLLIVLAIWGIKARICGEKSYLWMEICIAILFIFLAGNVLVYVRDKLAEEQPDVEYLTDAPDRQGGQN